MLSKKTLIVLTMLVLIISVLTGCSQSESDKTSLGNTNSNIANGGLSVMDQDWIYFMNYGKGNLLYKIKTDGSQEQQLSDVQAFSLNISGDDLFFVNIGDNRKIYRMKTDGSELTQITDVPVQIAMLSGDWIYFISLGDNLNNLESQRVFKIRTNGADLTQVTKSQANSINLDGKWVYYINSEDSLLYKIANDGKDERKISDEKIVSFSIFENEIFYVLNSEDHPTLWKMRLDGSNKIELSDETTSSFNVSEDWIYYGSSKEPGGDVSLNRMRKDGNSKSTINADNAMIINVHEDWLVYLTMDMINFNISQTIVNEDGSGRKDYVFTPPVLDIDKYEMGTEVIIGNLKYVVDSAYATNHLENTNPDFSSQIFDEITDGAYLFTSVSVTNLSDQSIDLYHKTGIFEDLGSNGTSTMWSQLADITNVKDALLPTFHLDRQLYKEGFTISAKETRRIQVFSDLYDPKFPISFGVFENESSIPVAIINIIPQKESYVVSWAQSLSIMENRFKGANIVQLSGIGFKFKGETEDKMYYNFSVTESGSSSEKFYLVKRDTGEIYNGAHDSAYPDLEVVPTTVLK